LAILQAIAGSDHEGDQPGLWLSEHTVKFHLTNIYRKLGVPNRSAAVRYAFENDLAELAADRDHSLSPGGSLVPRLGDGRPRVTPRLVVPGAGGAPAPASRALGARRRGACARARSAWIRRRGSQRSSTTETTVGPPGRLSIESDRPAGIRSFIDVSPIRPSRAVRLSVRSTSKPRPSSRISAAIFFALADTRTVTALASACSRTFASASWRL
jgi:hypothetical protein